MDLLSIHMHPQRLSGMEGSRRYGILTDRRGSNGRIVLDRGERGFSTPNCRVTSLLRRRREGGAAVRVAGHEPDAVQRRGRAGAQEAGHPAPSLVETAEALDGSGGPRAARLRDRTPFQRSKERNDLAALCNGRLLSRRAPSEA